MLNASVLLFAIAAVGGLVLAILHFKGKDRPLALALLHGGLGATALVLLLISASSGAVPGHAKLVVGLFLAAALGGILLFSFRLRKVPLSSPVVLIHGGVAATAFVILLASLYLKG